MDTMTQITLSVPRSFDVRPVWQSVDSLLAQAENRFSTAGDNSEIRALNERASNALPVSPELCEMLKTGLAYGDTLDGAFDITVLPLKEIWGLCEQCADDDPPPDSSRVGAAIQYVDYRRMRVNDDCDTVFFESPDTRIDVGGIAKGFVLTWLASLLKDRGIDNYLIAAGGDIIASGSKQDKNPWRVGIQHPRNPSELIATLPLKRGALVTSGDYSRFRIVDGNRYHHIFDPSTGYSCNQNQSVTILADDPVRGDIFSTGLFCKNAEHIITFINARDNLECLVVDYAGNIRVSDGWDAAYLLE
jgi:thiamine biosynthesis lipoprotein